MDFTLGFLVGAFVMWAVSKKIQMEWQQDLEKLEDFDTWKEWKNRKKD
jgi:type III secretory pathway component EscR